MSNIASANIFYVVIDKWYIVNIFDRTIYKVSRLFFLRSQQGIIFSFERKMRINSVSMRSGSKRLIATRK